MRFAHIGILAISCSVIAVAGGCGTTVSRQATEQLLASDAVDRSIEEIDFRDLSGKKVFLDTQYLKVQQGVGFVNADYIISAIRQQMMAADCLLQDKMEDSDYVVEARVGTLGADGHEISYGIPANNVLGTAATLVTAAPVAPTMPELSVAKRHEYSAAAKLGLFAYNRRTKEPVWQSGIAKAMADSRSTWVFGVGPFRSGSIHEKPEFAGDKLALSLIDEADEKRRDPIVSYRDQVHFVENIPPHRITLTRQKIQQAAFADGAIIVGQLAAEDRDKYDKHTFSLAAKEQAADNEHFVIVGDELQIKPGTNLDPAQKATYTVRVKVSDGVADYEQDFRISVKPRSNLPFADESDPELTVTTDGAASAEKPFASSDETAGRASVDTSEPAKLEKDESARLIGK